MMKSKMDFSEYKFHDKRELENEVGKFKDKFW